MIRSMYEARLPATQIYSYSGLITVEDNGGELVRFIIQRETACDRRQDVVSDAMIPRAMAAGLLIDKPLLSQELA